MPILDAHKNPPIISPMKKGNGNPDDDIVPEEGVRTAIGDADADDADGASAAVLAKLREKLHACEAERQEHLDGWQRANADLANYKREVRESMAREHERAAEQIIAALIPTLDSFTSARESDAWKNVEESWRQGVERIHDQFERTLGEHGLSSFGASGEAFDPNRSEAVGMDATDDAAKDHTISAVLQKGYMLNGHVVRPAKVRVFEVGN